MKAAISARLYIAVSEKTQRIEIQVPLLQNERDIDKMARTEICRSLKAVGINVISSRGDLSKFSFFEIDSASVSQEKVQLFNA